MGKYLIASVILALITSSCVNEDVYENGNSNTNIHITGTSTRLMPDHQSRAETISNLVENDSIIFSSTGGINTERDTLIYQNSRWNGLKQKTWDTNKENADYCAIHPILEQYDETNLYLENNELMDVICSKSTGKHNEDINLSFHHLFAKIQINIDNELNKSISQINITVPHSIENIDIYTGKATINNNTKNVALGKDESCKYEIFVPAGNQTISFEIKTTNGETHKATINNDNYQSGYEYKCNVKYNNGIYTKEDFIAFSHLINGSEYYDRKLDEFFIIKDGKRVFNLFADLDFTKEDMKNIKIIGSKDNKFNDIFDGNNHTISGIYFDTSIFF